MTQSYRGKPLGDIAGFRLVIQDISNTRIAQGSAYIRIWITEIKKDENYIERDTNSMQHWTIFLHHISHTFICGESFNLNFHVNSSGEYSFSRSILQVKQHTLQLSMR